MTGGDGGGILGQRVAVGMFRSSPVQARVDRDITQLIAALSCVEGLSFDDPRHGGRDERRFSVRLQAAGEKSRLHWRFAGVLHRDASQVILRGRFRLPYPVMAWLLLWMTLAGIDIAGHVALVLIARRLHGVWPLPFLGLVIMLWAGVTLHVARERVRPDMQRAAAQLDRAIRP